MFDYRITPIEVPAHSMLQPFPEYGIFPRWPEDGQGWIHPADVPIVSRLIPSERVLRRDWFDGTFYHYRYGRFGFRLRPCLWIKLRTEGIDVGDEVETKGVGLQREAFVARVSGMYFVRRKGRMLYRLQRGDNLMPKLYLREHLILLTEKQKIRSLDQG